MKIKPSDIKLGLEEKGRYVESYLSDTPFKGCNPNKLFREKDINQRLSELLNKLEEPIGFSVPPTLKLSEIVTIGMNNEHNNFIYKIGFRDGEEAHKKKVREVFLGR